MDEAEPRHVRRRSLIALALGLAVTGIAATGWWVAGMIAVPGPPGTGHARAWLGQLRVHHGYTRFAWHSPNCDCSLEYDYIGPGGIDPARVFNGPGLSLAPWPPGSVGRDPLYEWLLTGTGDSDRSGRCGVGVRRWRHTHDPLAVWDLSDRQRAGFRAGRLDILELSVICPGDDR
jgi:hypothetical protein